MLKKSLIVFFMVFSIVCISNICFAQNATTTVRNTVTSVTNSIANGVSNLAENARNGVGHLENGIEDTVNMSENANTNVKSTTAGEDYTTARTSDIIGTTADTGSDTTTMWIWIILAVAAIVIVALVWYYGTQNNID